RYLRVMLISFLSFLTRRPPISPLFPYTTLFRSGFCQFPESRAPRKLFSSGLVLRKAGLSAWRVCSAGQQPQKGQRPHSPRRRLARNAPSVHADCEYRGGNRREPTLSRSRREGETSWRSLVRARAVRP